MASELTPDTPTPESVILFVKSEQGELTTREYIESLRHRYKDTTLYITLRGLRYVIGKSDEIASSPEDNKLLRNAYIDAALLGFHVARHEIGTSPAERQLLAINLARLSIHVTILTNPENLRDNDGSRRILNPDYTDTILGYSQQGYNDAKSYHEFLAAHEPDISPDPRFIPYARKGFGLAMHSLFLAREVEVETDSDESE